MAVVVRFDIIISVFPQIFCGYSPSEPTIAVRTGFLL